MTLHYSSHDVFARTRIKICGIRDVEMARVAVEAGADAIGLVFVERSPRFVTAQQAREIVRSLPSFVEPVGLFADQCPSPIDAMLETGQERRTKKSGYDVKKTCEFVGLRTVQLHGQETPEMVQGLTDFRVIKALSFEAEKFSQTWSVWKNSADILAGILLDSPPRVAGDLRGGSGHAIDWNALAAVRSSETVKINLPVILAGGLTVKNVGEAIGLLHPFAVDVSSGVESSKGNKDATKIRAFCDAVRKADEELRVR